MRRSSRDKSLLLEVLDNLLNGSSNIHLVCSNVDFRLLRGLVRRRDTRELFDLSLSGLGVKTLGVTLLDDGEGRIDVDLDEGDRRVVLLVQGSGKVTVGLVGRDECGEGEGA